MPLREEKLLWAGNTQNRARIFWRCSTANSTSTEDAALLAHTDVKRDSPGSFFRLFLLCCCCAWKPMGCSLMSSILTRPSLRPAGVRASREAGVPVAADSRDRLLVPVNPPEGSRLGMPRRGAAGTQSESSDAASQSRQTLQVRAVRRCTWRDNGTQTAHTTHRYCVHTTQREHKIHTYVYL